MSYLAAHPEIISCPVAQYEFRVPSYIWRTAQITTTPANIYSSMHPDGFENVLDHSIGYNPYWNFDMMAELHGDRVSHWIENEAVLQGLESMCRAHDSYCDALAQDLYIRNGRFVAEKSLVGPLTSFVRNVFPNSHEIFLVRDFRDSVMSIRAFNAQRNTISFGRSQHSSPDEWVKSIADSAEKLAGAWRARSASSRIVRYEDLVSAPRETLRGIFDHIGAQNSTELIDAIIQLAAEDKNLRGHSTSGGIERSIGRWRTELTELEAKELTGQFRGALLEFGYEV